MANPDRRDVRGLSEGTRPAGSNLEDPGGEYIGVAWTHSRSEFRTLRCSPTLSSRSTRPSDPQPPAGDYCELGLERSRPEGQCRGRGTRERRPSGGCAPDRVRPVASLNGDLAARLRRRHRCKPDQRSDPEIRCDTSERFRLPAMGAGTCRCQAAKTRRI